MILEEAERLLAERQPGAAAAMFDKAEGAGEDPDRCCGGRWMAAMLSGHFASAWQQSDALRSRNAPDPHRFWDGTSLVGKRVIVRCLHGFGDAVQMLRYAPKLAATAKSVVWEVAPRLVELARCFAGVEQVITWGEPAPALAREYDAQVEVIELPYLFRTALADLPIAERYCRLPAEELLHVDASMGKPSRRRVGLVWAGGEWNRSRSVPFAALAPLLPLAEHWNLQGGVDRHAGKALPDATAICGDGLLPLAATIANLDLVITVDTLAAHLAGALGKPVWLLLQRQADWRWQAAGSTSPWYPTMRLFRQTAQGDWAAVIQQVCRELL